MNKTELTIRLGKITEVIILGTITSLIIPSS